MAEGLEQLGMTDEVKKQQGTGRLVVISGPSGVGKTVICDALVEHGGCSRVITATSRKPRGGEVDGVDYYFHDAASFRRKIDEGGFLEFAEVHGNLYGTPRGPVEEQLRRGETALLNIDVQGASTLMDMGASTDSGLSAVYIFVEPPSFEVLEQRLSSRSSDEPEAIALRLENARKELEYRERYDHCVVNDDLEQTLERIFALLFPGRSWAAEARRG